MKKLFFILQALMMLPTGLVFCGSNEQQKDTSYFTHLKGFGIGFGVGAIGGIGQSQFESTLSNDNSFLARQTTSLSRFAGVYYGGTLTIAGGSILVGDQLTKRCSANPTEAKKMRYMACVGAFFGILVANKLSQRTKS